jgi:hypothetical protein
MSVTFHAHCLNAKTGVLVLVADDFTAIRISPDSVSFGSEFGWHPRDTASPRDRAFIDKAMAEARATMTASPVFIGDLSTHDEGGPCSVMHLADGWAIAGTDRAVIGGMHVGSDGEYVIYNEHIRGHDGASRTWPTKAATSTKEWA